MGKDQIAIGIADQPKRGEIRRVLKPQRAQPCGSKFCVGLTAPAMSGPDDGGYHRIQSKGAGLIR